ncbi:MAG: signal peptidase I [bacterium]|nr:signal peptidase I [bacterium]
MALHPSPRATAKLAIVAAIGGLTAAGLSGKLARFQVAEKSMEPALKPGDYLYAALAGSVTRGDIVIYSDPSRSGLDLIKRVIGLPGETVSIAGGQVAIDGSLLAEPWADGPTLAEGEWTNPPGTIFTLGDNRRLSAGDSRASGPVSTNGMYRATWRYWPLPSVGRL